MWRPGSILAACVGLGAGSEAAGELTRVALDLLFDGAGKEVMESLGARLHGAAGGVPTNHDLEHAIRLAELTSTLVLLDAARRQIDFDQFDTRGAALPPFIGAARRWLHAQIGSCPSFKTVPNEALVADLESQLDRALSVGGRGELRAMLKTAEQEVWDALLHGAADNGAGEPPIEFRELFFGDEKDKPGWSLVFQAFIREALKRNPHAEIAFVTTRLAAIRETLVRLEPKIDRIAGAVDHIGSTVDRIESLLAARGDQLEPLRLHKRQPQITELNDLLKADRRATTLVGRQEELEPLRRWLTTLRAGRDISVHCLVGSAGAGKTRLAIDLCEWAEDRRLVCRVHPAGETGALQPTARSVGMALAASDVDRGGLCRRLGAGAAKLPW